MNVKVSQWMQRARCWVAASPIEDSATFSRQVRLLRVVWVCLLIFVLGFDTFMVWRVPGYFPTWYAYLFFVLIAWLIQARRYLFAARLTAWLSSVVILLRVIENSAPDAMLALYYLVFSVLVANLLLDLRCVWQIGIFNGVAMLFMPLLNPNLAYSWQFFLGPWTVQWITLLLAVFTRANLAQIETEHRQQLHAREENLRLAFETSNVGTWRWEVKTQRVYWSQRVQEMFGLETRALSGTYEDYLSAVEESDRLWVRNQLEQSIQTFQAFEFEHRIVRPDGSVRWMACRGRPLRAESEDGSLWLFGTVMDITPQKQAEAREMSRRIWLERVLEAGKRVTQVTEWQPCLRTIHSILRHDLQFDRVGLFLYDARDRVVRGAYGTSRNGQMEDTRWFVQDIDQDPAFREVLSSPAGFVFFTNQPEAAPRLPNQPLPAGREHATVAAWSGEKPVAVLAVDNSLTNRPMLPEQLEAFRIFAGYAGLALENARLLLQMRASEERFRLALEAARMGAWDWNLQTGEVNWSSEAHSIFGLQFGEFDGTYRAYIERVYEADRSTLEQAISLALQNVGQNFGVEHRIYGQGDALRWAESRGRVYRAEDGTPLRMIGTVADITRRKQAELALAQNEANLRRINEGLISLNENNSLKADDFDTALRMILRKAAQILAVERVGFWVYEQGDERLTCALMFEQSVQRYSSGLSVQYAQAAAYFDALQTGHLVVVSDAAADARCAELLPNYLQPLGIGALLDAPIYINGRMIGVVCHEHLGAARVWLPEEQNFATSIADRIALARETFERRRAEEQILQLNAELEQRVFERTEQLQAINKELEAFSYSVSHDLRTPLRAIDGFSKILLDDFSQDLPPEALRFQQMVRENAQRMAKLIDDLLEFSRSSRRTLHKETVAPFDVVNAVLNELEYEREQRQIEVVIGSLPACLADPALLKQVYANLLGNAFKFTKKRPVAHIELGCVQQNGESVYYVRDNGAGFDMRYAQKLFGVFQRLHRADEFEGTGIGLATVQRIIHRHGGKIWAESAPDQGATFYFTL